MVTATALRPAVWSLGAFAALYVTLFSPVLFSGRLLAPRDGQWFYYPHFQLARTLWDPTLGTGAPVAADPQTFTWYPPAVVLSLWPDSWNLFIVSAYVLASWFTFLYVRTLTDGALPAFVSGLAFGASGFMVARLPHATILHASVWAPALFFLLERLRARPSSRQAVAIAAVTFCCITGGHPQVVLYVLAAAALYTGVIGRGADRSGAFFGLAAAGLALGIASSAVQIVPTAELWRESVRSQLTFEEFGSYSLAPHQMVTFLFPYLLGGMGSGYFGPYFGPGEPTETTGYTGTAILVLAAVAVFVNRRHTVVRYWTVVGVAALLFALGPATPLGRLLYAIPIVGDFRAQGRFLVLVDLAAAVLAGFGLHAVLTEARPRRWLRLFPLLGLGALVAAAGTVAMFGGRLQRHAAAAGHLDIAFLPFANNAILIPLVAGGAVAAALLLTIERSRSAPVRTILVTAIVAELASFASFHEWRYLSPARSELAFPAEMADVRRELASGGGRWLAAAGVFSPRPLLPPELSALWNVPSASKFSTLLTRRYSELLGLQAYGGVEGAWGAYENRALDLAGVRFVGIPGPSRYPDRAAYEVYARNVADDRRWRPIKTIGDNRVFENVRALPRVWLTARAVTLKPTDVVAATHSSRLPDGTPYDPWTMALVEEPVALPVTAVAAGGQARVTRSENRRVDVETDAAWPSLLVLADLYYPGWTAAVDEQPVRIVRTNYIQRGVLLAPGAHAVRFEFTPMSFRLGALISGAAWLAMVVLLFTAAPMPLEASPRARRMNDSTG